MKEDQKGRKKENSSEGTVGKSKEEDKDKEKEREKERRKVEESLKKKNGERVKGKKEMLEEK